VTDQERQEYEDLKVIRDTLKRFVIVGYDIDDPLEKNTNKEPQMVVFAAMSGGKPIYLNNSTDNSVIQAFRRNWIKR